MLSGAICELSTNQGSDLATRPDQASSLYGTLVFTVLG